MIFKSLSLSVRPALEAASDYGNCTEKRKQDFLYGVDQFLNFLKSKLNSLKSFFVDFDYLMFKARKMTSLPATFTSRYLTSSSKAFFCLHTKLKVIQYRKSFLCYLARDSFNNYELIISLLSATSKRRDKVSAVEESFYLWTKQMKVVVAQGHQIVYEGSEYGPLKELEHWRKMLTKFNYVVEFTDSRPFRNYLKCLKLSRSKLIQVFHRESKNNCTNYISVFNSNGSKLRTISSVCSTKHATMFDLCRQSKSSGIHFIAQSH